MKSTSTLTFLTILVLEALANPDERTTDPLIEAFHMYDKDGDGNIAIGDLATMIESVGMTPEGVNTENNIKKFDANGDGKIDLAEFTNMFEYEADHFVNPYTLAYFKKYDTNGDGIISNAEFLEDMISAETILGWDVNKEEINLLFDLLDSNGDGNVSLGEFYAVNHLQYEERCFGLCTAFVIGAAGALGSQFGGWLWG